MTIAQKSIRIGCASAFWGDTSFAATQLVKAGQLDYLVFDYLAEMTMSIMAGAKLRNNDAGYAPDFINTIKPLLGDIQQQGIKLCSNAGGINPRACAQALQAIIDEQELSLKVMIVEGDNILEGIDKFSAKANLTEMFSEQPLPKKLISANAYLGAPAITQAFAQGADIVITGRVVDSAVVVGPLVHEFNWQWHEYDKLAQASLAGHIIECGTQCTGGNFTDWHLVKDGYANMGFPIIECFQDGRFIVSKVENTGGLVSCDTVAEQILYEIGDPQAYLLPDVICDFTQVKLLNTSDNHVEVSGAKGNAPSAHYKVSATYLDGYRSNATFMIGGIDAAIKGQFVAQAIIERLNNLFELSGITKFSDVNIEVLGAESTYGARSKASQCREVVVKIAVQHTNKQALKLFSLEIAQAATSMAPGITGLVGGRPKVSPRICLFSFLIEKSEISMSIQVLSSSKTNSHENNSVVLISNEQLDQIKPLKQDKQHESIDSEPSNNLTIENAITVPLISLALARSGDKGNHCNIGVIARKPEYLPFIEKALNVNEVSHYFQHLLSADSVISIYQLQGLSALNILMENCLGGGGMASLRIDPQGKALAQQLLEFPIAISQDLYQKVQHEEIH